MREATGENSLKPGVTPVIEAPLPDLFALWQVPPRPDPALLSFSSATPAPPTLWRIELPAEPALADATLAALAENIASSRQALQEASTRLDQLIDRAKDTENSASLSFAVPFSSGTTADPERELLASLASTRQGMADPGLVSFAIMGNSDLLHNLNWTQAGAEVEALLDHLRRLVTNYAWVESTTDNQLFGRTIVTWAGDLRTVWGEGFTGKQKELHYRNLKLAIVSKETFFHLLILVVQGALKLSAATATPGGVVVALPMIWRFVNQVIAEIRRYEQAKTSPA